jgi:hypothetical protein
MTGSYTVTLTATNNCGAANASMVIDVIEGTMRVYLPAVLKE